MFFRRLRFFVVLLVMVIATVARRAQAQSSSSSSSANPHPSQKRSAARSDSVLDPGNVSGGVYRNKSLGLSCKIPAGWVLRIEEMNARDEDDAPESGQAEAQKPDAAKESATGGKVLLAAFLRPPEARGEDINSSIVIAAESVAAYPGLKEPGQYLLGPVMEIAKAQGFEEDDEPYEFSSGTKTLARADFHKDVQSRVMHQSTLVILARGWAVSITFIGGTKDEVEGLVEGLSFAAAGAKK